MKCVVHLGFLFFGGGGGGTILPKSEVQVIHERFPIWGGGGGSKPSFVKSKSKSYLAFLGGVGSGEERYKPPYQNLKPNVSRWSFHLGE